MTPTALDFSDIFFTKVQRPRTLPGLSETDTAIVRWLQRLVVSREDGSLQVECIAWFAARLLTMGGVLVWLGQEQSRAGRPTPPRTTSATVHDRWTGSGRPRLDAADEYDDWYDQG